MKGNRPEIVQPCDSGVHRAVKSSPVIPAGDRGSLLVGALLAMLVIAAVGLMISLTVAEDMQITRNQVQAMRCLYIAESGLNYAIAKLDADPNWTGLSAPGANVGYGYFTVVVSDSTAQGASLPPGEKRLNVKGHVGSAEREIEVIVQ